jgi:hypothetical protein
MKDDLKMKLGDRKVLKSYVDYIGSLNKTKKKDSKKNDEKNIKQRRGSLSVQKKKESLLNSITQSIEH